jgi:hypothetical protein
MFEGSKVALVKCDQDCYNLAGGQTSLSITMPSSFSQHPLPQQWFRHETKVVHVTKESFPIHGILSSLASLPITIWGEYLFFGRNVIPNSGY